VRERGDESSANEGGEDEKEKEKEKEGGIGQEEVGLKGERRRESL
jgi:hypothetical protein